MAASPSSAPFPRLRPHLLHLPDPVLSSLRPVPAILQLRMHKPGVAEEQEARVGVEAWVPDGPTGVLAVLSVSPSVEDRQTRSYPRGRPRSHLARSHTCYRCGYLGQSQLGQSHSRANDSDGPMPSCTADPDCSPTWCEPGHIPVLTALPSELSQTPG